MKIYNTEDSYGIISKVIHWLVALIIIGLIAVGLYMTGQKYSPEIGKLYWIHKSLGVLVLVLFFIRVLWKLMNKAPNILGNPNAKEKFLAHSMHIALLVCMFVMPASGWLMSSSGGHSVTFFDLIKLPNLIGKSDSLHHLLEFIHEYTSYALIGLIAVHVAAVLHHHFIKKDATLKRMMFK